MTDKLLEQTLGHFREQPMLFYGRRALDAEERRLKARGRRAARRAVNHGRKAHRDLDARMAALAAGKFTPNDPGTPTKEKRQKLLQRRLHSALRAVALRAKGATKSERARRMVQCAGAHAGRS